MTNTSAQTMTAEEAWHELIEKDDRNSPEEYPDHALITEVELTDFMARAASAPAAVREVLEPLANIGGHISDADRKAGLLGRAVFWDCPHDLVIYSDQMGASITVGDVRKARAALVAPEEASTAPTAAQTMLADKIRYALDTEGQIVVFKESGDIIVAALRATPAAMRDRELADDIKQLRKFTYDGNGGNQARQAIDRLEAALATTPEEASTAAPQTLCGMIAAIYGSMDAEDCARIDREWATMRGYILPGDGTSKLASTAAGEAVAYRWRYRIKKNEGWSRWIPQDSNTIVEFRKIQSHNLADGLCEVQPLYAALPAAQTDGVKE